MSKWRLWVLMNTSFLTRFSLPCSYNFNTYLNIQHSQTGNATFIFKLRSMVVFSCSRYLWACYTHSVPYFLNTLVLRHCNNSLRDLIGVQAFRKQVVTNSHCIRVEGLWISFYNQTHQKPWTLNLCLSPNMHQCASLLVLGIKYRFTTHVYSFM